MKTFKNLSSFTKHLEANLSTLNGIRKMEEALEVGAKHLQKKAKEQFGKYPTDASPFSIPFHAAPHSGLWNELAPSTKADRVQKGFSENEPLLRTGKLRDSIKVSVHGPLAVVGSNEDIMVWQELGTHKIPPRPVLGLTAHKHGKDAASLVAATFVSQLFGKDPFTGFETIAEEDVSNGND